MKDGGLLHRTIIVLTLLASALSPSSAAGTDLRDYFPYLKTRPITEPAIGEIWSSLVVPQQPTGTEITLANNALILSGKQAAFRTLDGGKSWNLLGLDPTTLIAMSSLFAIAATDSEVYLTSDRGTSWQVVTLPPPKDEETEPPSIRLINNGHLYVWYDARLYVSTTVRLNLFSSQ